MRLCRKNSHGFTLLEVVVSVALVSVVLIPLMQMVPNMLKIGTKVEAVTRSTFLATQKMEEIKSLIQSSNASYGYTKNYTQSATAFPSPYFLYKFTISDNADAHIKTLTVTVWNDADGNGAIGATEYSVALDTKVAKR